MRKSAKPVRKCHACPLNLGERCWVFESPREQWRGGRRCRAFQNEEVYARFRRWQKQPRVKSSQDLRRESHRARRKVRPPGDRPKGE